MSGHLPPRRGKRKSTLSAFAEQSAQSKRMRKAKGKDEKNGLTGLVDYGGTVFNSVWSVFNYQRLSLTVTPGQHSTGSVFWLDAPTAEPPKPLPRRKSTEGFVGYRAWRIKHDDGSFTLASTATDHLWEGPVLRDKEPPEERESYQKHTGIHAYNTWQGAVEHFNSGPYPSAIYRAFVRAIDKAIGYLGYNGADLCVWGEVLLFGTVIVHEQGYRAQCAMIRSLYVPPETGLRYPVLPAALSNKYGCDVHTDYTKWLGGNNGDGR